MTVPQKTNTFIVKDLHAGEGHSRRLQRKLKQLMAAGVGTIVLLGGVYLVLLNQLATQGFIVQEEKAERYRLSSELQKWELELANESTLYAFRVSRDIQKMPRQGTPMYVTLPSKGVATR